MKLPTISVITPSFNQGEFIERTIRSVLSQRYPRLEFIVADGGSTDNTVTILRKYKRSITWFSEPDRGQADAINKGLRISTGGVITYLNSDDTHTHNTLSIVGNYFASHPKTMFLYGRGQLIDKNDNIIGRYNDSQMNNDLLFASCGISQPTAFWRREVYRTVGEFDTTLQFTMDYDYWIRVSKIYTLVFLQNTVLANTRIHGEAKTSRATHALHLDAIRTLQKHYGRIHYDWINTLADGEVHHLKKGNFIERKQYWLHMYWKTLYYHLYFNKSLPPTPAFSYYSRWLREIRNR